MNKPNLNRRKFLQLGAAATAGLAASASAAASSASASAQDQSKTIYRTLGKTGISVPIVSMGVMRADNPNILNAAYKLGITFFDTAHGYQDGRNEEMVGDFFKGKSRDSFIIATKIHPPKEATAEKFKEMLETSLKRLQLDYVDILYVHAIDDVDYLHNEEIMQLMKTAKEEGKTKHIGFSTHRNMAPLIDAAAEKGFYEVILTTYNFRLANDEAMTSALRKAYDAGIGLVGMKNMAGRWLDEAKTKAVDCKAALKWVLAGPYIHTCIPGIVSYEMLMDNWSVASDVSMTPADNQALELALGEPGMFCKGCNSCEGQCKHDLPVADLMRSYMYNYAYAYPAKAWQTVVDTGISDYPCADCDECTVNCKAGFHVRQKITNIARIQSIPRDFLV